MSSPEHDEFVELEFSLSDEAYPAISLSEQLDCRLTLLNAMYTDDGATAAYFHIENGDPETVVEHVSTSLYGEDATIIEQFEDEHILKLELTQSVFETLSDLQTPLQSLVVSEGAARFVVTIPPHHSPQDVISSLRTEHPSIVLTGKQQCEIAAPFLTQTAFQAVVSEQLTDRQLDALQFAFEYGYFKRPRNITQRELAAKMDISPSTFGQHLHTALRKLLAALFADGLVRDLPPEKDG